MVSAAIVLIVVTNYCIIHFLGRSGASASDIVWSVWPIALPSNVAVILVMSTLYHALQEVIGELEERQRAALEQAHQDPLTGLPNKRLLEECIRQAVARYRRNGEQFSVLMLDLDHFKRVNDLFGHQTGDELLREAACRLRAVVRDTDTVARFGGDEFLILQTNVRAPADTHRLCARILRQMQPPYLTKQQEARLPASVGAVVAAQNLPDANDYIRMADVALYEAKRNGRNCYRIFSDQLDAQLQRRNELERGLRESLRHGRGLAVHFQPQLNDRGRVVGAEALLRWQHADLGHVPAEEAICVAEEARLMKPLGQYVMREAALFARQFSWLSVAVNISPSQFSDADKFPEELLKMVRAHGVEPSQIELEITEQLFLSEQGCHKEQMERLRGFGFRIALDDFGTGYSSLSYLRQFKVDRLKLDRSFACDAEVYESVAIVRGAVNLAHCLGLEVIAEGIETRAQEAVALEAGCDLLQGRLYAAALCAGEFKQFLQRQDLAA